MKLKKFFALALAAATLALALTACGSKADDSADNSDANTDNQTGETVTVKLGVVGGIYDDLWAPAKAALADEGIDPAHAIYMGDDIPDLECMREVGIPVCPADAAAEVIEASRYVSEFRGGEGAVRDIVEQVLRARGDWARDSQGVTPSSLAASR